MNVNDQLKDFIYIVQDIKHKGALSHYYEKPTKQECFNFFYLLHNVSIEDFVSVFPLEKTYDGAKYCTKDYFYSKRALDTLLASGTTHFRSFEDIFDFFFEVHVADKLVQHIFYQAVSYSMDVAGYDIFDFLNELYCKHDNSKKSVSYLRPVK